MAEPAKEVSWILNGRVANPRVIVANLRVTCPSNRQVTEAACLCKCKVTGRLWHWEYYRFLDRARVRHGQPHYYGVSATLTETNTANHWYNECSLI